MAADGSIIIDTRIDTDGISSGVKEVQAAFKDLANSVKEINANINSIFHDGFEKLEDSFQSLQQKSEKVENSMDKMGNSAKKTGTTVSNSFNKMDISGASRKVNLLGCQFEGLGTIVKRIVFLVGSAFAVGKLIQFGKESIELGSDLAEVQNVVDVTFTTMSDKVNEFAKNAMVSAGLSETMAKRYVGTFGAMSKSFGFSEQQAYDMSTVLTQLTGDVASFYNISQDLAYIKLKPVFTGETETLKDLGVVMTQSALDQYALANGYGKTTSAMTEQEKVALRLAFVQKQLSAASGDFIRTSDSWANQVRVMQLQLQSLKATVGQGLINIFTPVLKVINILLGKLATLANAFKSFTELITGKKSSGQTSGSGAGLAGTGAIADTADQYGQAADNAEKLADATNDNAKATKKANKETKNYLSSLDEVHKVTSTGSNSSSTPSSSGGSGGAGNSGIPSSVGNVDYGNLAEGETALDKISDSAKKLADLLKKLWKPFRNAWKKEGKNTIDAASIALSGIAKLAKSVGKSLVEVWTNGTGTTMLTTMLRIAQNVLKTIGNIASGFADAWNKNSVGTQIIQNIADALVVVMQFVEKIAEDTATWAANLNFYPLLESISNMTATFAPILEAIGNVLEEIYNNIVLPMLKWLIETGIPTVINLVSDLAGFFADHQSIIEAFGAALIGAFAATKIAGLASSIGESISTIMLYGKGLVALMTGSGGIIGCIKAIATAIGPGGIFAIAVGAAIAIGVLLYKNWDKIKEVAGIVASAVVGFFKAMGKGVSMILSDLKETVTGILDAIGTLVSNVVSSIVKFVTSKTREMAEAATRKISDMKEKTSTLWNGMKANVKETWENIMTIVRNKVAAIRDAIVNKFTSARDRVVEIFGGIKDTIRDILNKVIGIANSAIGTVNSAIGGIESAFTFGPWKVPTPFGSRTIGFTANFPRVPTIPYLAKGAVIPPRSEFLAVLGDQKNGRNLEAPEDLLRQIVREETGGNQRSGGNYRFTAQLNRRTIFDEMIDEAKLRRDASGTNPFELA
nr:MAG TPA: minor tail protein [Caudoviricetes sp.]